jgi:hypothetical protein
MDFKNSKYRVDKIPLTEPCLPHFSDLMGHQNIFGSDKGLPTGVDPDKFLRYLIMMFGVGSPCIDAMPAINQRKTWVMKELGVEAKVNGEFPEGWNEVLLNKNAEARKRLVYFLHLQYSEVYANLRVAEMDFYTLLEMASPEDGVGAEKRAKARGVIVAEIEKLKSKLVQNETSILLAQEITKFVAMENMGIRPEDYMEFAPKPVVPKNAKANAIYPEIPA